MDQLELLSINFTTITWRVAAQNMQYFYQHFAIKAQKMWLKCRSETILHWNSYSFFLNLFSKLRNEKKKTNGIHDERKEKNDESE